MNIIDKSVKIAVRAHQGQSRKDGVPYIVHPLNVALILSRNGFDESIVAAGVLHDVIEDSSITAAEMKGEVGPEIVAIVQAVSEDGALPWVERKKDLREQIRRAPDAAKAVAVADHIHNFQDFLSEYEKVGPKLWDRWSERTPQQKLEHDKEFLTMIKASWKHPMVQELERLTEKEEELISQIR